MDRYRVNGYLYLEGLGTRRIDFEMESDGRPSEMDVLNYMMDVGIIQIIHDQTEYLDEDEEEDN